MNSLVVLGSTAAWAYSVVVTFLPGIMPEGTANVYYEASAVIVTLILLGRLLEAKAKGRTSEAIKRLVGLQAKTARSSAAARPWRCRSSRCWRATSSSSAPASGWPSTAW
jgi:cation transport ATPase